MVTNRLAIDIARPMNEVFAYLMVPENYLVWQSGVLSIETTNGMNTGSKVSFVSVGLGQRHSIEALVVENDSVSSFTVVARQGPITFESSYRLLPVDGGTRLELHNRIETGVVFRLAESALQSIGDSKYETDLKSLKAILESTV
jgi:hypothetical protein